MLCYTTPDYDGMILVRIADALGRTTFRAYPEECELVFKTKRARALFRALSRNL